MFATRLFPLTLALLALALPVCAEDTKAKETPEEAFQAFKKAVVKGDGDAMWNFFSSESRKKLVEQMEPMLEMIKKDESGMQEMAKKTGKTVEELGKMSGEEFVKTMMMAEMKDDPEKLDKVVWVGAEVKGNEAICTTKEGDKDPEKIAMVLEDGRWKLDLEKTEKLKGDGDEGGGDDEDGGDEDPDEKDGK